jgi:PIN domain nuclease of toxin-antitoxin system
VTGRPRDDPADRILVATAIHQGLTLVTADERILAYRHAMTLDARR